MEKTIKAIELVFINSPEAWYNSKKVRSLAIQIMGENIPLTDFNRAFLLVRDNLQHPNKKMVKFRLPHMSKHYYYSLTDKKILIANHNSIQERIKRKASKRQIG